MDAFAPSLGFHPGDIKRQLTTQSICRPFPCQAAAGSSDSSKSPCRTEKLFGPSRQDARHPIAPIIWSSGAQVLHTIGPHSTMKCGRRGQSGSCGKAQVPAELCVEVGQRQPIPRFASVSGNSQDGFLTAERISLPGCTFASFTSPLISAGISIAIVLGGTISEDQLGRLHRSWLLHQSLLYQAL